MLRRWPYPFGRFFFRVLCRINPPDNWRLAWIAWEIAAILLTPPDGY